MTEFMSRVEFQVLYVTSIHAYLIFTEYVRTHELYMNTTSCFLLNWELLLGIFTTEWWFICVLLHLKWSKASTKSLATL